MKQAGRGPRFTCLFPHDGAQRREYTIGVRPRIVKTRGCPTRRFFTRESLYLTVTIDPDSG